MIKLMFYIICDKCGARRTAETEAQARKVWLQKDGRQLCPKCDDQVHQFIKADDLPKKGWQPGYFMKKSPPAKVQSKIQGEYRHD